MSYATFASLMKKNKYDLDKSMKEFKDRYC